MITVTWNDVLACEIACDKYHIYIMYDGHDDFRSCLYVGKSVCAATRLLSHLGRGDWRGFSVSLAGRHVLQNMPKSAEWPIVLYGKDDGIEGDLVVSRVESKLIYELSPIFNAQGVKKDPWIGQVYDMRQKKRKQLQRAMKRAMHQRQHRPVSVYQLPMSEWSRE